MTELYVSQEGLLSDLVRKVRQALTTKAIDPNKRKLAYRDFDQIKSEYEKTYLSSKWVSLQDLREGKIKASDFSEELLVNGKMPPSIEDAVRRHIAVVESILHRFKPAIDKYIDACNEIIDHVSKLKGESAGKEAIKYAEEKIKELPDPYKDYLIPTEGLMGNVYSYKTGHFLKEREKGPPELSSLDKNKIESYAKLVIVLLEHAKAFGFKPSDKQLKDIEQDWDHAVYNYVSANSGVMDVLHYDAFEQGFLWRVDLLKLSVMGIAEALDKWCYRSIETKHPKGAKTALEGQGDSYRPSGDIHLDNSELPLALLLKATLTFKTDLDDSHKVEDTDEESDDVDSLETIRDVVALIQKGPIDTDPATQALVKLAVESVTWPYSDRLELQEISLESLDDVLWAMKDHIGGGLGKIKQSILSHLGILAAALPKLEDDWRSMKKHLDHATIESRGVVPFKGAYRNLFKQGQFPDDLDSYLREYASYVGIIATQFDHDAQAAISTNADCLASIEFNSLEAFNHSYLTASEHWADPRKDLPEDAFDFVVPGGMPFFTNKSTTYKGDDKAIKHFDTYSSKHIPYKTGFFESFKKVESPKHLRPMSLNSMRSLAKHFLEVSEKIGLNWHAQNESLKNAVMKVERFTKQRSEAKPDIRHDARIPYKYINRAYGITYDLGYSFKFKTLSQFVKVNHALLTYMKASLHPSKPKEIRSDDLSNDE